MREALLLNDLINRNGARGMFSVDASIVQARRLR